MTLELKLGFSPPSFGSDVEVEAEMPVQLLFCSFEKPEVVGEMDDLRRVGFGP